MKVSFRSHPEVLHYQEGLIAQNFFWFNFPSSSWCFDIGFLLPIM